MESEVKFSANELALLFFTYFSTQCAAVMAQFSLNNAAPQLWMYLPVTEKKWRQFIDFVVWIHNFLNSISIKGEIAVFGFESLGLKSRNLLGFEPKKSLLQSLGLSSTQQFAIADW